MYSHVSRPGFCLGCNRPLRLMVAVPYGQLPPDAPVPGLGDCCKDTEGARRLRATVERILSGAYLNE